MIFPEVKLEDWIKKYPELEVVEGTCRACPRTRITLKPFISKDFAGLVSELCECGEDSHISMSSTPISPAEIDYWNSGTI